MGKSTLTITMPGMREEKNAILTSRVKKLFSLSLQRFTYPDSRVFYSICNQKVAEITSLWFFYFGIDIPVVCCYSPNIPTGRFVWKEDNCEGKKDDYGSNGNDLHVLCV